jgi:hypothetical protein
VRRVQEAKRIFKPGHVSVWVIVLEKIYHLRNSFPFSHPAFTTTAVSLAKIAAAKT